MTIRILETRAPFVPRFSPAGVDRLTSGRSPRRWLRWLFIAKRGAAKPGAGRGGFVIDVAELERALRAADPEVFLVPPRILRRVIKRDRVLTFFGFHAARRDSYAIAGRALRTIVSGDELGLVEGDSWPSSAVLLARPETQDLADEPAASVLLDYWRRLYHARVGAAVEARFASGELGGADLRERIGRIGLVAFDEVRGVLLRDGAVLPPRDDRTIYTEFAAIFLELRHFAPVLLPHVFPAIDRPSAVEAVLARDVDGAALLARARPPGAPDPSFYPVRSLDPDTNEIEPEPIGIASEPENDGTSGWLERRAEAAGTRGNAVRAAILWTRAARQGSPTWLKSIRAARVALDRLAGRLQAAIGFDAAEAESWRQTLPTLLERSARGFWTPEARLLYDLQKVCVDHEREVVRLDLIDWAIGLGRRPLRRAVPHLREVMMSSHLHAASKRLNAARMTRADRERLSALLVPAVRRAEGSLRDRFRPLIVGAFNSTGLQPRNLPERVASGKLVEELLDRIVGRGFLTLGDLRDACSRSNLKLPDLAGPVEFFRGDRLLRTDRALADRLEGVYRRGEVYLRGLQRLSALAFGTPLGRFLTRYAALPYGGAFIILEGLQHLVGPVVHWFSGIHVHLMNSFSMLLLGTVALGLINSERFRRGFFAATRFLGRGLHLLFIAWPGWVLARPLIRRFLESRTALIVWRHLIKPGLATAPVWLFGTKLGLTTGEKEWTAAGLFLTAVVVLNSRFGRDVQEILADEAVRAWRQFWLDIVPGLFRLVLQVFKRVLETVERLLYAVDEWLRFRSGQSGLVLAAKAVLGFVWFFVAYLVRIYVNLLIEPQVNPIKHFPVVTVSHKIILPMSIGLTRLLAAPLVPLVGEWAGKVIAGTTVVLLPGVFGFLVWELKENWKLYEANRSESLRPVLVGEHGESLARLLRPGLHSGTLPKLFTKLRKAERRAFLEGRDRSMRQQGEALHHVEEAIRRFLERDFLALVHESRVLGPLGIRLGAIELATNRIRVGLLTAESGEPGSGLRLVFEEQSQRLVAAIEEPGWLNGLAEPRRRVLTTAFAGLYKMCGIDAVRMTGAADWSGEAEHDGAPVEGLSLWAGPGLVRFKPIVVAWPRWVDAWEKDQAGARVPMRVIEGITLLPRNERPRGHRRRPSGRRL